ncbi:hypothetical protein CH1034_300320 [Klebsiella pneumoniae]|nr:hypothetical protein SB4536_160037 [Klebsiella pneumoniae subsp. pneumoniae T69]CTQ30212.1 hypothetical protein CH1034_300320 [Klebsiella pneumoniae]SBN17137.1 conserved hypothetical protein [Klebsiella pneumoniae]
MKTVMPKLTIDEKKAVLHYAMIRQDSTSVELAVIVALSGAGGEPKSHPTEPQYNGRCS